MPATCRGKRISSIGALCPYPDRSSCVFVTMLSLALQERRHPHAALGSPPEPAERQGFQSGSGQPLLGGSGVTYMEPASLFAPSRLCPRSGG